MKELARTPLGGIAVEPKALERLVRDAAVSVEGVKVVRATLSLEEDRVAAVTVTAPRRAVLPELRRFYYDTAQASYPSTLAALTRLIPVSQILWGTDFPFRQGEEYVEQHRVFGFSRADLRKIERDNAVALLSLERKLRA